MTPKGQSRSRYSAAMGQIPRSTERISSYCKDANAYNRLQIATGLHQNAPNSIQNSENFLGVIAPECWIGER